MRIHDGKGGGEYNYSVITVIAAAEMLEIPCKM